MDHLKLFLLILILRLFSFLPLPWARSLGNGVGALAWKLGGRMPNVTMINLKICFPELSEEECIQWARESLKQTAQVFFESGSAWFWSQSHCLSLIKTVNNREVMDNALAAGKGVVLIAPHLGNWEVMNNWLASHTKMTAMYRPPKLKALDRLIRNAREREGSTFVPTSREGVLELYATLRRGEMVGVLPDQIPGKKSGHFAPFFGRNVWTSKLVAQLVEDSGCKVICAWAQRVPGGWDVHFQDAVPEIYSEDLTTSLAGMNQSIENCVRANPLQYQWEYKRFREVPEGEVRPYGSGNV